MTGKSTPERALEAPASDGELFRQASHADAAEHTRSAPDESEAAMRRLRTPFDVGPVDGPEAGG